MIRYGQAFDNIDAAVANESATWVTRAQTRTALFTQTGTYLEKYTDPATQKTQNLEPFWGEVKPLFMRRQFNKCVYCEQRLEGGDYGPVQWDLEHFRPKGRVREWPTRKHKIPDPYMFATGEASADGYYLLAYHLHNYAAACKPCNSALKSDYFPVAKTRVVGGTHPSDYKAEEAFLPYPLGVADEDPEDLITFDGATAVPKWTEAQNPAKYRRGRVTIDFFDLNREELEVKRAKHLLNSIWLMFKLSEAGDEQAKRLFAAAQTERAEFTACTKRFVEVCQASRAKAETMTRDFERLIQIAETYPI